MTLNYKLMFAFILAVIALCFGLLVYVAAGYGTYVQFLPVVNREPDYPRHNWWVADRWGNQTATYFKLKHPDGWEFNGVCVDPLAPAPNIGDSCDRIGGNLWTCGAGGQRIAVLLMLITPTPTETLTPTPLPTDTPEPTLPPPTGITETPTPEVTQ